MAYSVALISSPDHCDYIKKVVAGFSLPYHLDYQTFISTQELPALFTSIQDQYDAFCTTGLLSRLTILRTHPNCTKPVVAIAESVAEFYRILLNLLYHDRTCDFSRILFDHSLWLGEERLITALDYLEGAVEFGRDKRREFLETASLSQLFQAESTIVDNALALQRQNRLDLVVCRHSHAYIALKEAGIPCVFSYPSANNVQDSLRRLADELNLIRMGENLPGVICLSSPSLSATGPEDVTSESISLQKCLLDFDQENTAGMLIKKSASGFELFTTRHTMQRITQQFTCCTLRKFLLGRLGQQVDVGYGVGGDIMAARTHAIEAMEVSRKKGHSYLVDESGILSQPLDAAAEPQSGQPEEGLCQIAQHSGLSVVTLQRIRSALDLLGRNEITSQELAGALQVTVANISRFLKQLQAAGYATAVGEKRAPARGRPTKIYRIELEGPSK